MPTMTMTPSETGEDPAHGVSRGPGPRSKQRAVICSGDYCGDCQASKGQKGCCHRWVAGATGDKHFRAHREPSK